MLAQRNISPRRGARQSRLTAARRLLSLTALLAIATPAVSGEINFPQVLDDRLQLQLVASEPEIVTPTGIAVDHHGRVLVIESHTHFRPKDYEGPAADRILLLEDFDAATGKAQKRSIFYEGTTHTMSLAVFYDGSIYVATRMEIFRLRDRDKDGKADERTPICRLETAGNYPHNGLSGFAFDYAGNVYFGFGENLGATYKLIGSDEKTLTGGGEGGNIYSCNADGRELRLVATGFWNPFHLCFNAFGRLFAVDNDPDSRPPCRLLHIVEGGDYGFRFRNGRKGLHPFTAWNGELPGTLPMVSGTGEAPCAVLAYESDNLPPDYLGDLLVTSWGDHRLERYKLERRGASFTAQMSPVLRGTENFRPVGLALAPDGSLFMSDWVDRSYPLHGKGRVWRLSGKQPAHRAPEDTTWKELCSPHGPSRAAAGWRYLKQRGTAASAIRMLRDPNPRVRAAALLPQWPLDAGQVATDVVNQDPLIGVREAAFHGLNRSATHDLALAPTFVEPLAPGRTSKRPIPGERPDPLISLVDLLSPNQPGGIRAAALHFVGRNPGYRDEHVKSLARAALSEPDPFIRHAALRAQLEELADFQQSDFAKYKPAERVAIALAKRRTKPERYQSIVPLLLKDPDTSVQLVGIMWVGEEILTQYVPQLEELLTRAASRSIFQACLAAIHEIRGGPGGPRNESGGDLYALKALLNEKSVPAVRRFALRTIAPLHPELTDDVLVKLLSDEDPQIRLEAIRTMRERADHRWPELRKIATDSSAPASERCEAIMGLAPERAVERAMLLKLATGDNKTVASEAARMLRGIEFTPQERATLGPRTADVATSLSASGVQDVSSWLAIAAEGGDAAAGERIFFHARVGMCSRCHEYEGRGARIGPDLTHIGRSMTRERLVQSIVDPSREIAPQFTSFAILTHTGEVLTGMHVGDEVDGRMRYINSAGETFYVHSNDVEERQPSSKSIMPEGLAGSLTAREFRDLVAFLVKQP